MPIHIRDESPIPKALVANRDIGGGLNLKSSIFTVPSNQMVALKNYYLIEDGSLIGRRGTKLFNAASLGSAAINGGTRAYLATSTWLAQFNGSIQQGNDGAGTFANVASGVFQATALTFFLQYAGYMYATSNSTLDAPQKSIDGTTWTAMGIAAPAAGITLAQSAGGTALNGTYSIKVTFVTGTIESNPSPATADVVITNKNGDVASIPLGPAGTTKRRIYGFKNTVSSTYTRITEIADNTTTTFTIVTDQPAWGITAPTNNTPPVNGNWIMVLYKNRFWSAGDPANKARITFSQIFVPEGWPSLFNLDLPFEKGDVITALFVLGDLLLIFGNNQLFYLIGDTPFSFVVKFSFAQSGCPGPWAVTRAENSAIYLSAFALYSFDGSQARSMSDPIEPQFTGLLTNITAINYANANKASVIFFDRLKAVIIAFPTALGTNDVTYWYFLRRTAWVQDTRNSRMFLVDDGVGGARTLWAWDSNAGILRQWDINYDDDGVGITATAITGVFVGDNPETTKDWQWITLRAQPSAVSASVVIAGDQGVSSDTFSLSFARGAVIGTAIIGTDKIGAAIDDFEERISGIRARGVQVTIAVTYTVFFRLSELFLSYMAMGAVRRRVGT